MSMGVEIINEEQLAARLRANYQRMETENDNLRRMLAAVLLVNGPMELPADLHPEFTKGWEIQKKRVRRKVILSAVRPHAKAVA